MPESLPYAAPMPWYRRRRWLSLLTLLLLLVGYLLALPQYRVLRQHQMRRTAIRQQFRAEITAARKALDAGELDSAAMSLLNAEFPMRTEQELFLQSEADRCKEEVKLLRTRLLLLSARINAQVERERTEANEKLAKQIEEEKRRGMIVLRCLPMEVGQKYRKETLAALNTFTIACLQKHDYPRALQACRQVVDLEPDHTFDDAFWANAGPKP